jgi:hypothetical protein
LRVEQNRKLRQRLRFEDVVFCRDVAELNEFIDRYLRQQGIVEPEVRRRVCWALFHRWKESILRR